MALLKEEKNKIAKEFQNSDADTGSPEVQIALLTFLGESEQLPPNYSALKHKGKPMYLSLIHL